MSNLRVFAASLLATAAFFAPAMAVAQTEIDFTLGFGAKVAPAYIGSSHMGVGASGSFALNHIAMGGLAFGSNDPNAQKLGFGLRGAFNLVGARKAADHAELTGTNDIGTAVEIGFGLGYEARDWRAFADLRYGAIGHHSTVMEVGSDWKALSNERFHLSVGPRLIYGSGRYNATYFGITPAEAVASGGALAAFAPTAGLVAAGVEVSGSYRLNDLWAVKGTLRYDRLRGGAAQSPIVAAGSRDQASLKVQLTRRFHLAF